jgi:hypothetical protein
MSSKPSFSPVVQRPRIDCPSDEIVVPGRGRTTASFAQAPRIVPRIAAPNTLEGLRAIIAGLNGICRTTLSSDERAALADVAQLSAFLLALSTNSGSPSAPESTLSRSHSISAARRPEPSILYETRHSTMFEGSPTQATPTSSFDLVVADRSTFTVTFPTPPTEEMRQTWVERLGLKKTDYNCVEAVHWNLRGNLVVVAARGQHGREKEVETLRKRLRRDGVQCQVTPDAAWDEVVIQSMYWSSTSIDDINKAFDSEFYRAFSSLPQVHTMLGPNTYPHDRHVLHVLPLISDKVSPIGCTVSVLVSIRDTNIGESLVRHGIKVAGVLRKVSKYKPRNNKAARFTP